MSEQRPLSHRLRDEYGMQGYADDAAELEEELAVRQGALDEAVGVLNVIEKLAGTVRKWGSEIFMDIARETRMIRREEAAAERSESDG